MELVKPDSKIVISSEDIDKLVLPEGYEIKKTETKEERIYKEINRLEDELVKMSVPTDEELILEGKAVSPYYLTLQQIDMLTNYIITIKN